MLLMFQKKNQYSILDFLICLAIIIHLVISHCMALCDLEPS